MTELRQQIIAEMKRFDAKQRAEWGDRYSPRFSQYCTWWFRGRAGIPVDKARAELKRMERDGLVTADRSQTNNTHWLLTDAIAKQGEGK